MGQGSESIVKTGHSPEPQGVQPWHRAEFLRFLRTTYDEETRDHYHLIQRCGFILTAIVLLGTIAGGLANANWIKTYSPRSDVVLYTGAIVLVFAALAVAGVFLILALRPRDWESVPDDMADLCGLAGVEIHDEPTVGSEHESRLNTAVYAKIVADLAKATDANRKVNFERYRWLQWAFVAIVVTVGLLLVQLALHVIVFLNNP